ncbi:MAG: hypothetical protein HXX11_10305 [Desulfuromonadales bacterium]|nr:hypothetical protein [Desulfuromonadales bacterium]
MEMKKIIGITLFLVGAALFYSAFTVGATEALGEWVIKNVPDLKGQYTPKQLLIAWGGLLAGLGGLIGFRKV